MSQDMSLSEIDNMIRIYSDKIFELQEQRAKLTGKTFYKLGATEKKLGKQHMTNYKIEIAKREIESELLAKVKAEISAEYPDTDDDFDINDWMYHLELNTLATPILKYGIPVPTPRQLMMNYHHGLK